MKLKSVKIHDYKCFFETNEVDVAEDITCLVGVNETGKSLFLESLIKTMNYNGIDTSNKSFKKTINSSNNKNFCTLCWSIEDDRELIKSFYAYSVDNLNDVITRHFYETGMEANNFVSRREYIEYISEKYNIEIPLDLDDLDQFINLTNSYIDLSKGPIGLSQGTIKGFLDGFMENLMPRFLLFNNSTLLHSNIKLSSIYDGSDTSLNKKILTYHGLSNDVIYNINTKKTEYEFIRIKHLSESYCNDILRKYWPEESIDIQFTLKSVLNDRATFDGYDVITSFKDNTLISPVDVKSRSQGLQSYVSLMLSIAMAKDDHSKINQFPLIVLIDEPDSHLHPAAQKKMTEFIYNLLNIDFIKQVIYTTHSPFMIKKERIDNIRVFENISGKINIHSDIYKKKDNLSILPLSYALGYNLSDTMFVNNYNNICTEGESDILYMISINKELDEASKIKGEFSYVTMGGLSNSVYYCKFLKENGKNPILILDNKKGEDDKYSKSLDSKNIIFYKTIVGKETADVEDLFGMKNYTHLMIKKYPELQQYMNDLKASKNFQDFRRILKTCTKDIDYDCDNHAKPAEYLRDHEFGLIGFPEPELIKENFAKLFKRINEVIL